MFNVNRFMAGEGLAPSFKKKLKYSLVIFLGTTIGYLSAKLQWESKKHLFNKDKLTEYQCQDHINTLIEKTRKPAIIYYYLPMSIQHHSMRSYMLKYSNLYPDNAIWVMANLTQELQHAKEALQTIVFPLSDIRLEVRFPKQNLAVFESNGKDLQLIRQTEGNRRQVFNYQSYQQDFRKFLEQHKIIKGQDPIEPTLNITETAIFSTKPL